MSKQEPKAGELAEAFEQCANHRAAWIGGSSDYSEVCSPTLRQLVQASDLLRSLESVMSEPKAGEPTNWLHTMACIYPHWADAAMKAAALIKSQAHRITDLEEDIEDLKMELRVAGERDG